VWVRPCVEDKEHERKGVAERGHGPSASVEGLPGSAVRRSVFRSGVVHSLVSAEGHGFSFVRGLLGLWLGWCCGGVFWGLPASAGMSVGATSVVLAGTGSQERALGFTGLEADLVMLQRGERS
jgi:hypothetical protein